MSARPSPERIQEIQREIITKQVTIERRSGIDLLCEIQEIRKDLSRSEAIVNELTNALEILRVQYKVEKKCPA